jgi:hypothetical protein
MSDLECQMSFARDGGELELCITPVGAKQAYAVLRLVKDGKTVGIGIYSEEIPRLISGLKEAWRRTGGAWRKDDAYAMCFVKEEAAAQKKAGAK